MAKDFRPVVYLKPWRFLAISFFFPPPAVIIFSHFIFDHFIIELIGIRGSFEEKLQTSNQLTNYSSGLTTYLSIMRPIGVYSSIAIFFAG